MIIMSPSDKCLSKITTGQSEPLLPKGKTTSHPCVGVTPNKKQAFLVLQNSWVFLDLEQLLDQHNLNCYIFLYLVNVLV